MIHFYCMKAYRDWLQIQDPQILTVGSPIESKDVWLLGQLFWRDDGSKSRFDTFPSTFAFGSKAFEPWTYLVSISKEISVPISIPEEQKKIYVCSDTESRNSTHIEDIEVEFREITLYHIFNVLDLIYMNRT